jgi:ATP-binding cassette subfamily C protein CydD
MASDSQWLRERGKNARRHLAITVALGELSGILLILQTALLVAIGNGAIMERRRLRELLPFFAALLGVVALRFFLTWRAKRSAFECASVVKRAVRGELIEGLRTIGPIALAGMRTGEIAEIALGAVESLDGYYSGYLPQRAIATLLPFTVLASVFPLDWISGLVLVLTAVFLPLSMIVIGEEAHERNQRLWATLARISGRFLDALRGLATIKMFGASRREAQEIQRASEDYRLATMSVLRIAFLSSFMLEFITALSIAIVAVVTGLRLLSGGMRFAPGYFILLIAPEYFLTLRALGTQYHARMGATSAAGQLRRLFEKIPRPDAGGEGASAALTAPAAPSLSPSAAPGPSSATASALALESEAAQGAAKPGGAVIEFEEVRFAYADRPVLEGLTFSLSSGEHLALAGPSGCGKSTVLALLLGFAKAQSGRVAIDGRDIRGIDRDELYESIAWLPQRPGLFHGTIRYNIGLGRPGASERDIAGAARAAHVDEFAESLSSGLDTIVGEGGRGLSAGQVQRLALARLFLRSPRLLLLDEPTAHLDAKSEELVNASIAALSRGRSMIMVTHMPSPSADRRLEMRAAAPRESR